MTQASDVAHLILLNGGRLVGKTRLQKSAYFLEAKGVGFGFDFSYHHFGPYSEELSNSADDAIALKLIDIDWKTSQAGARYAIFRVGEAPSDGNGAQDDKRKKILDVLSKYSAVELELAATADFFERTALAADAWAETKRRKSGKLSGERLHRSKQLLEEIKLI
jgi:uncharacterized protein